MLPHALFGVRVRGCKFSRSGGSSGGGKGGKISISLLNILGALRDAGMSAVKIPFWRTLYRQGRRG